MTGGTGFSGAPAPNCNSRLIRPGYSMNKDNQRFDYQAGAAGEHQRRRRELKRGCDRGTTRARRRSKSSWRSLNRSQVDGR